MGKDMYYNIDMQQYDIFFSKKVINIIALKIFFLTKYNDLIMRMNIFAPNCWKWVAPLRLCAE